MTVENALPAAAAAASEPDPMHAAGLRTRAYQMEMYERSLKHNVIVVMDTGSGKTQVALLRIIKEFETCSPSKRVWFLAPKVVLCQQQHDFLSRNLPVTTRLLIGTDNVDRWKDKTWDVALENVRLVVSTPQILYDALQHGFVAIGQLALIVFDEAHHCARGDKGNELMQRFYHPKKQAEGGADLPHILGLSATPSLRSSRAELPIIERNLDAIAVSPHVHREELFEYVHRPDLQPLQYATNCTEAAPGSRLSLLLKAHHDYAADHPTPADSRPTRSGLPSRAVSLAHRVNQQLVSFCRKAEHIFEELGAWPCDFFIAASISILRHSTDSCTGQFGGRTDDKETLLRVLSREGLERPGTGPDDDAAPDDAGLSPKVLELVSFLSRQEGDCSGIIFVQQRAAVSVLHEVLSRHPAIKNRFRCATFVGTSGYAKRTYGMAEMLDLRAQRETLPHFKARRWNIVIATDVLEEGIDVSACNLVVCFDPPPNMKSLIQRRGRARQAHSQFAIMFPGTQMERYLKIRSWQELEDEMSEACRDPDRLNEYRELEQLEEPNPDVIRVESTGACLFPNDAVPHLNHFCAHLPREPFVDPYPFYRYFPDEHDNELVRAVVTLPGGVSPSVRSASSRCAWRTERAAKMDAAFQAYAALYREGLLNDNLLPMAQDEELFFQVKSTELVNVCAQYDPWPEFARRWDADPDVHHTAITLTKDGGGDESVTEFMLVSPVALPHLPPLTLHWEETTLYTATFGPPTPRFAPLPPEALRRLREVTHVFARSFLSFANEDCGSDYIMLFSPIVDDDQVPDWLASNRGSLGAMDVFSAAAAAPPVGRFGIIRNFFRRPAIFDRWIVSPGSDGGDAKVFVQCVSLPKKRSFVLSQTLADRFGGRGRDGIREDDGPPKLLTFDAADCVIDRLPHTQVIFGMFNKNILQHVQAVVTAHEAMASILRDVPFRDVRHIVTALSSPISCWHTDYQRYEFIGDAVLKYVVSCQLFSDYRSWHEGLLTDRLSSLVSNGNLTRAALASGLERFIMTITTNARLWGPVLMSELKEKSAAADGAAVESAAAEKRAWRQQQNQNSSRRRRQREAQYTRGKPRRLPAKLFADVIEALIGAAYIESGLEMAKACTHLFLPNVEVAPLVYDTPRPGLDNTGRGAYLPLDDDNGPDPRDKFAGLQDAERLIGHTFRNKALLLQALTHPSFQGDYTSPSYQRLEFLGDAVLDMLATQALARQTPPLTQGRMTWIKAALVNANLVGFLCMDLGVERDAPCEIVEHRDGAAATAAAAVPMGRGRAGQPRPWERGDTVFVAKPRTETVHVWSFMRCSPVMEPQRRAALERFRDLRKEIPQALREGREYPWRKLARLGPPKFFSDLVEAILGAILVDGNGDLSACEVFARRLGVWDWADAMIFKDSMGVSHPKTRLHKLKGSHSLLMKWDKSPAAEAAAAATESHGSGDQDGPEVESPWQDGEGEPRPREPEEDLPSKAMHKFRVLVGGVELATVLGGDCLTSEEVEVRAVEEAVMVLEQMAREGRKLVPVGGEDGVPEEAPPNESDGEATDND